MALVVLLKGINVGGHRTVRPTEIANQLRHLDAVSVGSAGTFVIRRPIGRIALRAALQHRLPRGTQIMICQSPEIVRLARTDVFSAHRTRPGTVRFVSVLARRPRQMPPLPMVLPSHGRWLVKVLARDGRFIVGLYRRQMQTIRWLAALDRAFGLPVATRNWKTITALAAVLERR